MNNLYRHYDVDGTLLYVGISLSAVKRLSEHMRASHWNKEIAKVEIATFPDKKSARQAELDAIAAEKPLFNVAHTGVIVGGGKRGPKRKLSVEQIDAAEVDYDDLTLSMRTVSEKHDVSPSTLRRLFDERGEPREKWWRKCSE